MLLGMEAYDITEIEGADSLYEADGIIRKSEENAGCLFGAATFYSTEGSSHCIRAMLCLAAQYAAQNGKSCRKPCPTVAALCMRIYIAACKLLLFFFICYAIPYVSQLKFFLTDKLMAWVKVSPRSVYQYGCELFRKRMECAIMVAAARSLDKK